MGQKRVPKKPYWQKENRLKSVKSSTFSGGVWTHSDPACFLRVQVPSQWLFGCLGKVYLAYLSLALFAFWGKYGLQVWVVWGTVDSIPRREYQEAFATRKVCPLISIQRPLPKVKHQTILTMLFRPGHWNFSFANSSILEESTLPEAGLGWVKAKVFPTLFIQQRQESRKPRNITELSVWLENPAVRKRLQQEVFAIPKRKHQTTHLKAFKNSRHHKENTQNHFRKPLKPLNPLLKHPKPLNPLGLLPTSPSHGFEREPPPWPMFEKGPSERPQALEAMKILEKSVERAPRGQTPWCVFSRLCV